MQIVARLELKGIDEILEKRGMKTGGKVQKSIDKDCIRFMKPYTPFITGRLQDSATDFTVIGSGKIIQFTPYARYQYYGMLMVDPITLKGCFYNPKTGKRWSRPKATKIMDPNGRELNYHTHINHMAGSHWFERMAFDHKDEIGASAALIAGGKFKK